MQHLADRLYVFICEGKEFLLILIQRIEVPTHKGQFYYLTNMFRPVCNFLDDPDEGLQIVKAR